jgi:hypothetical protein
MKGTSMDCEIACAQIEAWRSADVRRIYAAHGAGDNAFGASLGNLRSLTNVQRD